MAGIEDPNTIDLVTHDSKADEYALIMVETRRWENSDERLAQLRQKINGYAMFVLDEGLIRNYPDAAGKPVRMQLDCIEPPTGEVAELIEIATQRLSEHRIRFLVNVLA